MYYFRRERITHKFVLLDENKGYINVNTAIRFIHGRDKMEILIKGARIVDESKDFLGIYM